MKYLCLISAERMLESMPPDEAQAHFTEYLDLLVDLKRSGHYVTCDRLAPPETATTVRVRAGRLTTTDGPFAETKEQLGGFFIINARDMNQAIHIASRIPGARIGCVEVRPIATEPALEALKPENISDPNSRTV